MVRKRGHLMKIICSSRDVGIGGTCEENVLGKRILRPDKVKRMRAMKSAGKSLLEIADCVGCSVSTVSLYCRDLYTHPARVYATEELARERIVENARTPERKEAKCAYAARKGPDKGHGICIDCGKRINRRYGYCPEHNMAYRKEEAVKKPPDPSEPKECVEEIVSLPRRTEEISRPRKQVKKPVNKAYRKEVLLIPCSGHSPTGSHYWVINTDGIGICKYCKEKKQFIV